MVKKIPYSFWTGLKKTLKNMGVMFGVPALLYFFQNITNYMPESWLIWALPLTGTLSYFVKNYLENK